MKTDMKTKLVWRLSTKPTVDEVLKLVESKVLTNEEAKEIIFSSETESSKDIRDLEAEIKFLKDLVLHIAGNETIRETIRYIEKPYYRTWDWYTPTVTYLCSGTAATNFTVSGASTINGVGATLSN